MAAIETTYSPSGVQTNTEGLPLSSGGDLNSVLAELVRRKLSQPAMQADPGPRRMAMPVRPMRETQIRDAPREEWGSPEAAMRHSAVLKAQAAEQGPLMKYSGSGFNLPQRLEMDDQHMNAYQRQMYLPSGAGMAPGGADTQTDQEELLRLRAQLAALQGGR